SFISIACSLSSWKNNKQAEGMFKSLPASQTKVDFVNNPESRDGLSILYYLYYYNGGGVAIGDINNDGLQDIYFSANAKGKNKLYLNKGHFQFEDITDKAGVAGTADWSTGVTMADVNGDGLLDIYVCASSQHHGLKGENQLFINNGNLKFSDSAKKYNLNFSGLGTQAAFFDYDHDGDLDCYLLNHSLKPHQNIKDTSAREVYDSISGDRLLRNDLSATGTFTDVSKEAGIYQSSLGYGLGIAIADFNNDGWDDIYVGNDFHENDYYYLNTGQGKFIESGANHFGHYSRFSMGNDAADFNNDGQPDIFTADMLPPDEKTLKTYGSDENLSTYKFKLTSHGYQDQVSRNCLQRNNGNGDSYSDIALQAGVSATDWSWAPLFADFDNDGKKDLFISSGIVKRPVDLDYIRFVSNLSLKVPENLNSTSKYDAMAIKEMPDGASHPYFFKGDAGLSFIDVSEAWGTENMKGYFNGAAYADLDLDGNLDMVINCINAPAVILQNKAPQKLSIDIKLKGSDKNTFGIGAKVWLFVKGKMQFQQLQTSRGFMSSCAPVLHFGLDSSRIIDSLLVVWPNQKYQVLKNVPGVPVIEISQNNAGGVFNYRSYFPPPPSPLLDITSTFRVGFTHRENSFLDFNKQYLIPHMESTRGPKVAVADVNKDGLDDIFVCGASGNPGQLLIQKPAHQFSPSDTALFNASRESESVDAVFFDANKDGWPDLYVVAGGNQFNDGDPRLADRFYLNDGKGHFTDASAKIPAILKNKSCVAVADMDKDGDEDLFVGGLANATQFGIPQPSYILVNNGSGMFTGAGKNIINLDSTGIVTSAGFADLDKNGWPDLVVGGEWMPLKVFYNTNGKFREADLPKTTGLWQSIYPTDVNGDGLIDFLAGNWGHNSKLWAGKNGPLKLYIKDFDNNGAVEQVMCYTINGEEYTFLAKDELERALPVLKKAYLHYSDVAGKTVQYMFYDLFKGFRELKAELLTSSCFINDGKGGFLRQDLPDALQLSPIFSFTGFSNGSYLAAGNFYGTIPYEGPYDALFPTFMNYNKDTQKWASGQLISNLPGEVRDLKWINQSGKNILILARNNDSLRFFQP
ncbi:MAG: VCBS repeat-containing protein, partial [Ferruginibacter sp.]|nr:VCBS repeat-containing protein [Ferruginibacter sp.]